MSAELLKKPSMAELVGAAELSVKKFKPGDIVAITGIHSPLLKVMGYGKDPRTGEERIVVIWFDKDNRLNDAGLKEEILELV